MYLGLLENVRVRRAGFAFRMDYTRFLLRSAVTSVCFYRATPCYAAHVQGAVCDSAPVSACPSHANVLSILLKGLRHRSYATKCCRGFLSLQHMGTSLWNLVPSSELSSDGRWTAANECNLVGPSKVYHTERPPLFTTSWLWRTIQYDSTVWHALKSWLCWTTNENKVSP